MAKSRTRFVCDNCGHDEPKWLGHCPSCQSWNSFKEFKMGAKQTLSSHSSLPLQIKAERLDQVQTTTNTRIITKINEIDRLLGGGVMSGSSVLVGGEPGIGKSTLLLQLACSISHTHKVLYISAEETPWQIKQRAERLELKIDKTLLLCQYQLESILHVCQEEKPEIVIIDSLQTLLTPEAGEVPGTVSQLKLNTSKLIQWSRDSRATMFLVAHVTKEGVIAGPRTVEHLVDTVLYFEHNGDELRCLRAQKNRFGSTQEIGLFVMQERGLFEVNDPTSYFLEKREKEAPVGTSAAPVYEGSRILLLEIQALTVPSQGATSRVYSEKIDQKRISRIAAVMEKHLSLKFSDQDIYVHVTGGLKINEPGADLPIALALYSARTGLIVDSSAIAMGELTLSGEIRHIQHIERRIKAAQDQGFSKFIIPKGRTTKKDFSQVSNLKEALSTAFKGPKN